MRSGEPAGEPPGESRSLPTGGPKGRAAGFAREWKALEPGTSSRLVPSAFIYLAYAIDAAARKKAFDAEYGDWTAAQNARFEAHGRSSSQGQ